jgi:hypothetical protein
LSFGVAASVAANILHANPNPISQAIAAWPPLALLLTVELVSRVPVHRRALSATRVLATVVISGIAAWVSYWHMAGVASRYGETGASPYLLPVSVDGLIVVASICLVELSGRIRDIEPATLSTVRVRPPVSDGDGPGTVLTERDLVPVDRDGQAAVVTDELLDRARAVVAAHRRSTGRDITRDELRASLRVQNATAGELLRLVRAEQPHPTGPTPRGNGQVRVIGELTR